MNMDVILADLDRKVEIFLSENLIKTRRGSSHGIWLNLLLPVVVIFSAFKYDCSQLYKISSCISFGLLINALLTIVQLNNNLFLRTLSCFITSSITVLSLIIFTTQGLIFNLIFGVLTSLGYQLMLLAVLKLCPHSFTFGEASVVTQGGILFFSSSIANFGFLKNENCMQIATLILQIGLVGLSFICIGCFLYPQLRRPNEFYLAVAGTLILFTIPVLHILLGFSPVFWIINLLTADIITIRLVSYWIICCVLAVSAVLFQISGNKKATTIVRKIFHLLAVAVFIPGLIYGPCLLYLASGIVFAIFVALELLRLLKMPPIGLGLEAGFIVFSDEKDEGPVALTAIYLLVGCAGPLWIHPLTYANTDVCGTPPPYQFLPLLAGLLSVGVGDTAASVCGTLFGQNFWPSSRKSKEGSAACFLSQLFVVIALIHYGFVPRSNLLKPMAAIAVASVVEAKTDQVDNLVLPLLMYLILLIAYLNITQWILIYFGSWSLIYSTVRNDWPQCLQDYDIYLAPHHFNYLHTPKVIRDDNQGYEDVIP